MSQAITPQSPAPSPNFNVIWAALQEGDPSALLMTTQFLVYLVLDAIESVLPLGTDFRTVIGQISDAIYTSLFSLTRPLLSEEGVGAYSLASMMCIMIPAYWGAPTFTSQFQAIPDRARRTKVTYTPPRKVTILRSAVRRSAPNHHELAQLTSYAAIFIRNNVEGWHASGGLSDAFMPLLNRTTRNALFSGLYVLAWSHLTPLLSTEAEAKLQDARCWAASSLPAQPQIATDFRDSAHRFTEQINKRALNPGALKSDIKGLLSD